MNNNIFEMQKNAKYKSARISLLLIVIFSVVNIFSMMFAETYFLFSAYFPQLLIMIGLNLYAVLDTAAVYIVFACLALISVVPYLLCYIFSNKKVGWMIAALVLFSIDSLLFLVDFISLISVGETGYIVDLVIRIYALWSLGYAVKCGLAIKNTPVSDPASEMPLTADAAAEPVFDEMAAVTRKITVTRKKSFAGCAVLFYCLLDGVKVGELKSGQSAEIPADGRAHTLGIISSNGIMANEIAIPAGEDNRNYLFSVKTGMTNGKVIINEVDAQ